RWHASGLSTWMVAWRRAKQNPKEIGVTVGVLATTTVEGTFTLAYLVCNTIMNLTTQDAQVACFQNVAAHLEPGGCFVIEVGLPELQQLPPGESLRPLYASAEKIGFDEYDVARQGLISHHYRVEDGRLDVWSI